MVQTRKPTQDETMELIKKKLSRETRAILGLFENRDTLKSLPLELSLEERITYRTTIIKDVVNAAYTHLSLLNDGEKADALEHIPQLLDDNIDFDSVFDVSKGLERLFKLIYRQIIEFTIDNHGKINIIINQPMKFFIDSLRTMPQSTIRTVFSHIIDNMFQIGALSQTEKSEALSHVESFARNPTKSLQNIGKLKKVFNYINEGNVFVGKKGGKTLVCFEERGRSCSKTEE